jgi:hypothetical protein
MGDGDAGANGGTPADAGAGAPSPDPDALIVPESVAVMNLSGEDSGFNVTAFTLVNEPDGTELYATLLNERDVSGCDGSASFELFDHDGASLGAWIGGLYSEQLFKRSDEMGGLVACIEPGARAFVALTDLPADLPIASVGTALYQLNYFDRSILPFELEPVEELTVTDLDVVEQDGASVFTGTFVNGLDVAVTDAAVTVFALSAVGRPLSAATTTSAVDVAPGESWQFETAAVIAAGVEQIAFPSGSVEF